MGESPSARTHRELAELRGHIDADVDVLLARAKADADPRALARRQPVAVFGTLGSVAALGIVGIVRRVRESRRRRPDSEIERVIDRLGGRVDKLRGRARRRLRDQLRAEIGEVEQGPRAQRAVWEATTAGLTAGATLAARQLVTRLLADDDQKKGTKASG